MNDDRQVRPFADWLRDQRNGRTHDELSDALNELVEAVQEHGKAGSLAPYEGCAPYKVIARLRFRMKEGDLFLGYVLDRPSEVLRSAFDDEVAKVETATGLTAYRGRP